MNHLSLFAIVASMISAGAPEAPEADPPNILLLLADDLGTDMLKPYKIGKDLPKTPNLDALAKQSVLFRNAWSTPMCSPTRACIQTGRLGIRTGIGELVKDKPVFNGLPMAEILIPELLDSATNFRYEHAFFGKWHINHLSASDPSGAPTGSDVVRIQGYGHHEGMIHNFDVGDSYFDWAKVSNGVSTQSNVYATTATVDDFLSWQANIDEPYFSVLAFNAPHAPLHAPPVGLYSEDLSFVGSVKSNPRPYFKAMVEALDSEIGRLLGALAPSLANTTVIFMSDNGTPGQIVSSDPFQTLATGHAKGFAYEGGVNVPLYVSGPSVLSPGSESVALVHVVDIFATVAELAGIDLSDTRSYPTGRVLDSQSLIPYLEDPTLPSKRRFNYTERFFENTRLGGQIDFTQISRQPIAQTIVESTYTDFGPQLSMIGQAIVHNTDNSSTITLSGAPKNAEAFALLGGFNPSPNPAYGGLVTVSPKPFKFMNTDAGKLDLSIPFVTDSNGSLTIPGVVHHQSTKVDYHVQFAIQDPVTLAWQISNAIRVNQTTNVKAIVDVEGYKLISHVSGGPTELYHLPTDPRETNDLLASGVLALNEKERAAYQTLRTEIRKLLESVRVKTN